MYHVTPFNFNDCNCWRTLNSRLQRLGHSSEALPSLRYSHPCTSSIKPHACCIINLSVTISRVFMARRKSERVVSAEKRLVERVKTILRRRTTSKTSHQSQQGHRPTGSCHWPRQNDVGKDPHRILVKSTVSNTAEETR